MYNKSYKEYINITLLRDLKKKKSLRISLLDRFSLSIIFFKIK